MVAVEVAARFCLQVGDDCRFVGGCNIILRIRVKGIADGGKLRTVPEGSCSTSQGRACVRRRSLTNILVDVSGHAGLIDFIGVNDPTWASGVKGGGLILPIHDNNTLVCIYRSWRSVNKRRGTDRKDGGRRRDVV